MQGLMHYSDDSDDSSPPVRILNTNPFPTRQAAEEAEEKDTQGITTRVTHEDSSSIATSSRLRTSTVSVKPPTPVGQQQRKTVTGVRRNTSNRPPYLAEGTTQRQAFSSTASPPSRSMSTAPSLAFGNDDNRPSPYTPVSSAPHSASASAATASRNITQIPQQPAPVAPSTTAPTTSTTSHATAPPTSSLTPNLDPWDTAFREDFAGLSDDAVFKAITRPPGIPGVEEWGIPIAPVGRKCSASLQAKVSNFLKMKVEQDRHINTTLLASTAFTNPHIYSKLVEFVDIDERGSAFPGGGWLTRRGLESRIPEWGAKALSAQQKAQETALLASQSAGKRKTIDFTTSTSGGSGSGRSSKRRDPPTRAAKYPPSSSSSSAVAARHLSAEAAENQTRVGERERSKRDSRSAGGEAVPSSGSRRRDRLGDASVAGYSVNTGEGVSRRYERDRQEERGDGGKRSVQSRRWD